MEERPINTEAAERQPMLYTEEQRDVYARLNNEVIVAKANLADALEAVTAARKELAEKETTLRAYSRTMVMERGMAGAWTPTATALIPR